MAPLALSLFLFSSIFLANSLKYDAHQKMHKGFTYMGKFCFRDRKNADQLSGHLHYDLSKGSGDYVLTLYDDQEDSFPAIHNNDGMSCNEKLAHARYNHTITFDSNGNVVSSLSIRQKARPRWWWLFLTKCDGSKNGESIHYKTHFKQIDEGSWSAELGHNEKGMNTLYLVFLIVYFGLLTVQMWAYYTYKVRGIVHQLIKLICAVIFFQMLGIACHAIDWIIYTETGYRQLFCEIAGNVFMILASSIFLLLLFLLAQGWTVSHFQLQHKRSLLAFVIFVVIYKLTFFVWKSSFSDDEDTRYFYNGLPMWCYGAGMATAGMVYAVMTYRSWSNEVLDSKKSLYLFLGGLFTWWFLLPLLQIFIGDSFDPWVRDIAVTSIELVWDTITFGAMMLLLWPAWAHTFFNLKVMSVDAFVIEGIDTDHSSINASNSVSDRDGTSGRGVMGPGGDTGEAGRGLTGLSDDRL